MPKGLHNEYGSQGATMIPGCLPDFRSKEGISAAWLWERRTGWGQSGLWGAGHLWMALLRSWGLGR